jgi:hypothetical protein
MPGSNMNPGALSSQTIDQRPVTTPNTGSASASPTRTSFAARLGSPILEIVRLPDGRI